MPGFHSFPTDIARYTYTTTRSGQRRHLNNASRLTTSRHVQHKVPSSRMRRTQNTNHDGNNICIIRWQRYYKREEKKRCTQKAERTEIELYTVNATDNLFLAADEESKFIWSSPMFYDDPLMIVRESGSLNKNRDARRERVEGRTAYAVSIERTSFGAIRKCKRTEAKL